MVFAMVISMPVKAQNYDLLIKGGIVIDPKNDIHERMDIAISKGVVAAVNSNIPSSQADQVIDANGLLVVPGIIDIHGHVFNGTDEHGMYSNGMNSVPPDGFTLRNGVTTIVDAGGPGWRNIHQFKDQTIDNSKTRVLAFLNIVGSGMKGGVVEQNKGDMDAKLTGNTAKQYSDFIVGIKLAHYMGPDWDPVERAVEAGNIAEVPVMIDFGGSEPILSLETLFMEKLRPGDIYTHAYAALRSRGRVVNADGKVEAYAFAAQKRGIVFDVGHGGGSFTFEQAIPAMKQGFKPNVISTDLHIGSMNGGMKDQLNVMSKFLNMEMPLYEVVESATWNPARYIKRTELGHLSVGAIADIAVLKLKKGEFGFVDVKGVKIIGDQKLECELTIKDGNIVYDLNGLSKSEWKP
jgi:dihydroorotase